MIKTLFIFYVDVGSLPPFKAEQHIEKFKENILKNKKDIDNNIALFIPTRPPGDNRVDVIHYDTKGKNILLFNINVGTLPPEKAEAFMNRTKEQYIVDDDIKTLWISVRRRESYVEVLNY